MHPNLQAVAFDLDNTLWEVGGVIERAELRLVDWLRANYPRIPQRFSVEAMRVARLQLALDEPHRAHDFTYLRTAALARHALDCGYDSVAAEQGFEVFFTARNEVDVFPDVAPALDRLRPRYALATLTNGNADLARIGIAASFEFSLSPREVGKAKPHFAGFQQLADRLSLARSQVLYVGDDPLLDVEAAHAAGMRAAWMNRIGAPWPAHIAAADLVVRDCLELAAALGV